MVKWKNLESNAALDSIVALSKEKPCLIFKHSTRCSISIMAKSRLERDWDFLETDIDAYYLDLLNYKSLSNSISERFRVHHESPQVLLIRDGVCTYDASHLDITVAELKECFAESF